MDRISELTEVEVYDPEVKVFEPNKSGHHHNFTLYHTDLKFKKHRNIDIDRIVKYNPHLSYLKDECHDTIEYRKKECLNDDDGFMDLSHMDLDDISSKSDIPDTVRFLFLSDNQLLDLPELIDFKYLKVLDICNNKIVELPELPESLEELSCRNNYIENIDELANLKKLKKLDISYNNLEEIPNIRNLETLLCYNNRIKYVHPIRTLKILGIRHNKLTYIESFKNLTELDCDHNNIRKIDGFDKLTHLYINNNDLEWIGSMNNIRVIELKKNRMTKFPFYPTLSKLIGDYKKLTQFSKNYKIENIDVFRDNIVTIFFNKNT